MDQLFNVNQAAFILKVHPLTIRRYINEGKLKAIRAGGSIRISEASLAAFKKDFSPYTKPTTSPIKIKLHPAKVFTTADPLHRLKGRGATIHLESDR